MADQTIYINTIFQLRRGEADRWSSKNPILREGEPGFEIDTNRLKIGNGTQDWNTLPYLMNNVAVEPNGALSMDLDASTGGNIIALKGFSTAENNSIFIKTNNGFNWQNLDTSIQNVINNSDYINDVSITNIQTLLGGKNSTYQGEAFSASTENNNIILYEDTDNGVQPILAANGDVYSIEDKTYLFKDNNWQDVSITTQQDLQPIYNIINNLQSGTAAIATPVIAGLVKSSNGINEISVDNEGIMSINKIGVDKLENVAGVELVLVGGMANFSDTNE